MRAPALLIVVLPAALVGLMPQSSAPGAALTSGMRLTYASAGAEQPAWVVESVERPLDVGGRSNCVRISLRMAPPPAAPEARAWCVRDDVLIAFVDSLSTFRPLRPVGPGMTLDLPRAAGGVVRYETGQHMVDTISGHSYDVLPTTVTTIDATGRAIRRLRERYALALTTAVHGVFETADSTQTGGWRVTQEFQLVAIRPSGQ